MNIWQTFYMAEAEGLLPTRAGKINAVIRDIKDYPCAMMNLKKFLLIMIFRIQN